MRMNLLFRKLHSWGAIIIALPLLVVITSGILLQLKKQLDWVQPPEMRGTPGAPAIGWDRLLGAATSEPTAGVRGWEDVRRIDVRPDRGLAKIWTATGYEIQVDLADGRVLHSAYRRSDLIESLHDGSWFHEWAKLGIFLPAGLTLLGLWLTGIYLFILPIRVRRRKARLGTAPASSRRRRIIDG